MSDDFIPLNQSTPVRRPWQQGSRNQNQRGFHNNRYEGGQRRGGYNHNHQRGNNSRNSSYRSDSSSSFRQDNIDAYLHPSMLEDPWAKLKQKDNKP